MRIDLDFWQLLLALSGLLGVVIGAFWAVAKMLINASQKAIDEKFQAVSKGLESQDATNRRLERDLMELKAELPREYVRREDYTIAVSTITTKIDSLALRMETAIRDAYAQTFQRGSN